MVWGYLLIGAGVVLAALGLLLVGAYIHGVYKVLGEADQSWMFWGLVLPIIGVPVTGLGIGAILWGRSMIGGGG